MNFIKYPQRNTKYEIRDTRTRAFTLIEVLVAALLMALVMIGLGNTIVVSKNFLRHARSRIFSTEWSKVFLEPLQMNVRQADWDASASDYIPSNGLRQGARSAGAQAIEGISYSATYQVGVPPGFPLNDQMRKVIVNITWNEG